MTLTIQYKFPAGRYHATPWGSHVNEGLVEWPPSPWRLLRGLLATWYWKARDEFSEDEIRALLDSLASEQPHLYVPRNPTRAHTRHYMPLYKPGSSTKLFDAFIHLDDGQAIWASWPNVTLSAEAMTLLSSLLQRLGYLGRAESWVEASLGDPVELEREHKSERLLAILPMGEEGALGEVEVFRLLSPMPSEKLKPWCEEMLAVIHKQTLSSKQEKLQNKGKDPSKAKLTKKEMSAMEAMLPESVMEALEAETADLQKAGWSQPPGSQWVDYVRPLDVARPAPLPARASSQQENLPTVARFALSSPVMPRIKDAHRLAQVTHQTFVKRSDLYKLPVFTGSNGDKPSKGHRHASIFAEANLDDGKISHLTVYAPMGFCEKAQFLLEDLVELWRPAKDKKHEKAAAQVWKATASRWGSRKGDLRLVLVGMGKPDDFAGFNTRAGQCPLFATSKVWHSTTPFVPVRHPKETRRGVPKCDEGGWQIGSPRHDLRRLLVLNGYPEPIAIDPLEQARAGERKISWLDFYTKRDGGGTRGCSRGFGFRIEFAEPVMGPIAMGYGAHYGLGLFAPGEQA